MAARRLIVVMLVLLFISSIAAALAPVREPSSDETTTSTTAPATPSPNAPGLVSFRVSHDEREPPRITARQGDQLQLVVESRKPGTVVLAGIGPTDDVDRLDPARFDVIVPEGGPFAVEILETGKRLATIEVEPPAAGPEPRT